MCPDNPVPAFKHGIDKNALRPLGDRDIPGPGLPRAGAMDLLPRKGVAKCCLPSANRPGPCTAAYPVWHYGQGNPASGYRYGGSL